MILFHGDLLQGKRAALIICANSKDAVEAKDTLLMLGLLK